MGNGYGSEWHLLRYLGRHRQKLDEAILKEIPGFTTVDWMDFNQSGKTDKEHKAIDFLVQSDMIKATGAWKLFWPRTGNPPNWDAIGRISGNERQEYLLVEAKAHLGETVANCSADDKSRIMIKKALADVQKSLRITPNGSWESRYYQMANRIAILWFLDSCGIAARLVTIYFYGDSNPESGKVYPQSKEDWEQTINDEYAYLGIDQAHPLADRIHRVFIPV